jgi:hypothetical protein
VESLNALKPIVKDVIGIHVDDASNTVDTGHNKGTSPSTTPSTVQQEDDSEFEDVDMNVPKARGFDFTV